jgi:hypothetical protein
MAIAITVFDPAGMDMPLRMTQRNDNMYGPGVSSVGTRLGTIPVNIKSIRIGYQAH